MKIVHLGIGAFARCHLLHYTQSAGGWDVIGVSLRSRAQRDSLKPQNYIYTTLERSAAGIKRRQITCLKEILVAPENPQAVLEEMENADIVSLTITEKGYCFEAASGRLNFNHPDIRDDLAHFNVPKSAIGFITKGLESRFEAGRPPFIVLCCDNLSNNGKTLGGLVYEFALRINPALATWIKTECAFPNTMVDRIVPAQTPQDSMDAGDVAALSHEPFSQWVIEDSFQGKKRPAWEVAGAQFVKDVAPFERMKLRMLNGAHSALAYQGFNNGFETIGEVVANKAFNDYLWKFWGEVMPFVKCIPTHEVLAYAHALEERFLNPALRHKCAQIAMDGSQKLPPRLLNTLQERRAAGLKSPHICRAIAAWILYVKGYEKHEIHDPLKDVIIAALKKGQDLLSLTQIFPLGFSNDAEIMAAFKANNL